MLQNEIQLNLEDNYTAPSRIELLPSSPISGRDGRKFTYDGTKLVNDFIANAVEIPFDINHNSELSQRGADIPAIAWLNSIEFVDNKIYGNVEWNSWGEYRLERKAYKYISPALITDKNSQIIGFSSIALVNKPNLKVPALNSMETNIHNQEETMKEQSEINKYKEELDKQIELNTQATKTIAELNAEVSQLQVEKINTLKAEAIDTALTEGKISPATKDYYIKSLNSVEGINEFKATMDKAPSIFTNINKPEENSLKTNIELNEEQKQYCADNGLDEQEFIATKKKLFN